MPIKATEQTRFDPLCAAMPRALRLQGKAENSVEPYTRAIRRSADFLGRCPDDLTAEDLQSYFAACLKSHFWSSVKLDRCGLQPFYRHVLKRPWTGIVKPPRPQRLPDVLTQAETVRLLGKVCQLHYRAIAPTLGSTRLRPGEQPRAGISSLYKRRRFFEVEKGSAPFRGR